MRITANRETAEELTVHVFHHRLAARVPGRRRTLHGRRLDHEPSALAGDRPPGISSVEKCSLSGNKEAPVEVAADSHDVLELRKQGEARRGARQCPTSG
jgi:RNA polymerase sigma-70 factor, ECF subfamily